MNRKINELLTKLYLTDVNSSEFMAVSKELVEAYKEYTTKKLVKKSVELKPKKEKVCSKCVKFDKLLISISDDIKRCYKEDNE